MRSSNENVGAQLTVGEAWDDYLKELAVKNRSEFTINDYARGKRSLPDWFLSLKVGAATEDQLGKALDECTANRGKT